MWHVWFLAKNLIFVLALHLFTLFLAGFQTRQVEYMDMVKLHLREMVAMEVEEAAVEPVVLGLLEELGIGSVIK